MLHASEQHISDQNAGLRSAGLMAEQLAERNGTSFETELNKETGAAPNTETVYMSVMCKSAPPARGSTLSPEAAPTRPPEWSKCEWGHEIIVGCRGFGYVILPLIEGNTPESPVAEMFRMAIFHGEQTEVDAHFKKMYEQHIGKPAGLLALISEESESNYTNCRDQRSTPTPNEAAMREANAAGEGKTWEWVRNEDGAWVKQSK